MTWLILAAAIVCEVLASLSLKASATAPALYAVVVVGYICAFYLLVQLLRRGVALGVTYGIWGASGVAATSVAASILFDEPMTPLICAGLILIGLGVLLIRVAPKPADTDLGKDNRSGNETGY
ncbi:QacE family quaternary ammonium compound efflux SMR transporter [Mycobacterium sp. CBMA293]|uniref:DMT family transporter n=1 Tax=unclassified Mycolicibacterium TaxID=2636767 RepID=UPI0012DE4AF7|nr:MULTISPECIES: SMR family transporter [unclassified Mycolicibacterium]MUL46337.1 QacE family quaternary ammonium compound efflux SMR transporter [Mycolicibacterium sp. CBMA 360]MUL57151.1 QacE family quaternary ammonium compound efflux SMR transporter [Mycolicibacterium sp. CBMA 335]MUL70191.1 QacE family quaternary ammonium compound efflux SMR transporter [Mycolicibacterium sp. CBMA 311]MUL92239.1 QacE family quaternary ammonium compound efflux SMR transporter [Mycolicibacterium sp. CBMA 230